MPGTRTFLRGGLTVLAAGLAAWFAVAPLYAAFCAFTWDKFTLDDYGKYSNMLWNTGHGMPFRVLVDYSYLQTHLSFSLAPLGLLFRLWDHAFLPALLQWMMFLAGGGFLWRALRRLGLRALESAAILLGWFAHPYNQSVVLSEFHGVALYLVLVPWLYHDLRFRRARALLPLVLLCGVREEAAFLAVPMLAYFACAHRWKRGWAWAAGAAVYGVAALVWLFPALSGMQLAERRTQMTPADLFAHFTKETLPDRLAACGKALAPAAPLLGTAFLPVLVFPSVALAFAFFSPHPNQFLLLNHYPAAVMSLLFAALPEALWRSRRTPPCRVMMPRAWMPASVAVIALALHVPYGFLPLGGRCDRIYTRPHPDGLAAVAVAGSLPKEGLLVTSRWLAGYCGNRRDVLPWDLLEESGHAPEWIFFRLDDLFGPDRLSIRRYLADPAFGVAVFDRRHVALRRGADAGSVAAVYAAQEEMRMTIKAARMISHVPEETVVRDGRIFRVWPGGPDRAPTTLAYGKHLLLPPGDYCVDFHLRIDPPRDPEQADWGSVSLHVDGAAEALAELDLRAGFAKYGSRASYPLSLVLEQTTPVEPRVTAGAAPMRFEKVVFRPLGPEDDEALWKGRDQPPPRPAVEPGALLMKGVPPEARFTDQLAAAWAVTWPVPRRSPDPSVPDSKERHIP